MKKNIIIFTSIGTCLLLAVFLTIFFINRTRITVSLRGENTVEIEVFSKYKEPGIDIRRGNKPLARDKYKLDVITNLDPEKVGSYKMDYKVDSYNKTFELSRKVVVVDKEKPEITLSSETLVKDYCSKANKNNIEYKAVDNYDKDITDKVVVEEKEDKVIYKVSDSSGNLSVKEAFITYEEKPDNIFKVNGSDKETVLIGTEYTEKGASYTDGCGNKLKGDIKISGSVDTSVEGDYTITYTLNGKDTITRTVHVKKYQPKNIYLTFDDGPGANTSSVLNTLDKYGVKATFFVTNQFPSYQHLIAEEKNRGHAIGVHTLTHSWNIYNSVDDYINDFNAMNEIIFNQTGSYTKIFRFPGGSSNTVSKSHSQGVVTAIAAEMTNRGYVYYDWNLASGDADKKTSTEKIKSTVINRVDSCRYDCVILFHDYKKITADAIDPILAELTARGYTFSTLDENGPLTHSKIAN